MLPRHGMELEAICSTDRCTVAATGRFPREADTNSVRTANNGWATDRGEIRGLCFRRSVLFHDLNIKIKNRILRRRVEHWQNL